MSDIPTCPQFPARPPHGGEPFIAPPAPCWKPGLPVLSVNGRVPDGRGNLAFTYIDGAEYVAGYGDPPRPALLFRQGDKVVAVVDATPLLKDGMVSSVAVSGGNLVVTFNTDAGREPVSVPLAEIFDPGAYYDKTAADGRFALKGEMSVAAGTGADADKTTITLMPGVLATVLRAHQPLDAYFNAAEYDSANKKILFKHGSVVKAQVDATAFVKDGMVSSVEIDDGDLVITFNTDAGLEPIEIPLTDIFDPADYYDKDAADAQFVAQSAVGTAAAKDVPTSGNASTTQVVMGNDSRLTDARTPTAHKSSHATGGSDAIAPSDIGAAASSHTHAASDITSGLATVATSGSYNDLSDKPTIPTVPTNVSAFTNDAGYVTTAALRYDLASETVIDTASQETVEGETVNYGVATLADRTGNRVSITAALDELRVTFPPAVSGKLRDFGLRVEVGTGSAALTAPAIVPVAPTGETIKLENNAKQIPALADGAAAAKGVTLLYFSESAPGVFFAKGEQVGEVA